MKSVAMLDPRITNIGLDANTLDRNGTDRDSLIDRFCLLAESGILTVVVAGGVRDEIQHPRTPAAVQAEVLPRIFNLRPGLIAQQREDRQRVISVLQGNAQTGKHAADASHISEAAETGCAYFITHDKRILARRDKLSNELPPSLSITTLEEFIAIYDRFESERPL